MMQCPLHLEIMLHCYVSTEKHPREGNARVQEGYGYLCDHDMIVCRDGIWQATERGRFFVEHLLSIPFPECHWTIPNKEQAP